MLSDKKVAFIGAGAMAEALVKGLLATGKLSGGQCTLSDIAYDRLKHLSGLYSVNVTTDNSIAARQADILILSVKPQVIDRILSEIKYSICSNTLVISIAAGVKLSRLEENLPGIPVIRVMPNTPAAVGAGMTAISLGGLASSEHGKLALTLFEAVGKAVIVGEELMDAVTGLSGSGPGYAFIMIDALADAGVNVGFNRQTAIMLAAQTLLGAAKMVLDTGEHPAKLRDMVASPSGTTIAGIHTLEKCGVRAALIDAVAAATKRSVELGK